MHKFNAHVKHSINKKNINDLIRFHGIMTIHTLGIVALLMDYCYQQGLFSLIRKFIINVGLLLNRKKKNNKK